MKITGTTDYYRYNFKITIYTEPEVYKPIVLYTPSVRVRDIFNRSKSI